MKLVGLAAHTWLIAATLALADPLLYSRVSLSSQIEIWNAGGVQALCMFPALAAWACLLRVGVGLNKYLVWGIMSVVVQFARRTTTIVPEADRFKGWPEWAWPVLLILSLSLTMGVYIVRNAQRAARRTEDALQSDNRVNDEVDRLKQE